MPEPVVPPVPVVPPAPVVPPVPTVPPTVPAVPPVVEDAGKADRDALAAAQLELAALRADKQAAEDAKLSDIDKANKAVADKETELTGLRAANARLTALATHPVPAEYQHLVTGTDATSYEASAKAISALAAAAAGKAPLIPPTSVPESGTRTPESTAGGSMAAGAALYNARKK